MRKGLPAALYWLCGAMILSVLTHASRLPLWIISVSLLLCVGKFFLPSSLDRLKVYRCSILRLILSILMMLAVGGVYATFGTIVGLTGGVAMLVLLAGFKLMEIEQARDFYAACFMGYFLVVTNFLYTQTMFMAVYMALVVLLMTLSLVLFNDKQGGLSSMAAGRIAAALLLQSVPVMLVAFVLFPRVSGPLWGLPDDSHTGLVGVDDEMSPGSISKLIQSDKVAFRVDFKDQQPDNADLYWRGAVLWYDDGRKWVRGLTRRPAVDDEPLEQQQGQVEYTVTLEPHNQKWLYALETPVRATPQSWLTDDRQLFTKEPIRKRVRYEMVSDLRYGRTVLSDLGRKRALQLPRNGHPQSRELMRQWLAQGWSEDQIVQAALRMFAEDEFYYTLQPPLLQGDRVDEFLFKAKRGFCEHYSSAFVVMMRAAGIPARVVLGYQGGEYNPVGDYLMVYQRNAHAWSEVWREGRGWQRVDPTSAVAPSRIIDGIEYVLPDVAAVPMMFGQNSYTIALWQHLRYRWDALNNQWYQWVISYDPQRQRSLLSRLGLETVDWAGMTVLAVLAVALCVFVFAVTLLRMSVTKGDPVARLYQLFCRKLARSGIVRLTYEGPVDFSQRAAAIRLDLAAQISHITALYVGLKYVADGGDLEALRSSVRRFKV